MVPLSWIRMSHFMPPASPQQYHASLDTPGPDEEQIARDIADVMLQIAQTTWDNGGHALRSVHAKSHGLLKGELQVLEGLPVALAQGMFSKPAIYPALMRFSTTPGDLLSDKVSTPRGVAIKVLGVEGERLEGSEDATTQDFVMVNGPRFSARDGKAFLRSLKPVAATTDKAPRSKQGLSALLRGTEALLEAIGGKSTKLRSMGGEPPHHILGETFFSQLPLRHGQYIAKLQLVPVAPELTALTGARVDLGESDNALRDAVVEYFRHYSGQWELRAQLCTDLEHMPIDDTTMVWNEKDSHFVTIARLSAGPQTAWSPARSAAVDDGLGFSPWHGLQAHRPLGELMRLRKLSYETSQRFRMQHGKTTGREPVSLNDLPD